MEKLDSIKRVLDFYLESIEYKNKKFIIGSIVLAIALSDTREANLSKVIRMILLSVFDKRENLVSILDRDHELVKEYDEFNKYETKESTLANECLLYLGAYQGEIGKLNAGSFSVNSIPKSVLHFYHKIIVNDDHDGKYFDIFDFSVLALIMQKEFDYDVNLSDVFKMLVLHQCNCDDELVSEEAEAYNNLSTEEAIFACYCENLYYDLQLGILTFLESFEKGDSDYYFWLSYISEKYNNPSFSDFVSVLKVALYSDLSKRSYHRKEEYFEFNKDEYLEIIQSLEDISNTMKKVGLEQSVEGIYVCKKSGHVKFTIVLNDDNASRIIECKTLLCNFEQKTKKDTRILFSDDVLSSYPIVPIDGDERVEELLSSKIIYDKCGMLGELVSKYDEALSINQIDAVVYIPPIDSESIKSFLKKR